MNLNSEMEPGRRFRDAMGNRNSRTKIRAEEQGHPKVTYEHKAQQSQAVTSSCTTLIIPKKGLSLRWYKLSAVCDVMFSRRRGEAEAGLGPDRRLAFELDSSSSNIA